MIFKGGDGGGELNGFLDSGSHIQGELQFEETFRVDGRISGRVHTKGELVIGEPGRVDGELEVSSAVISGVVTGRIRALKRVEITASARVSATIETPVLIVEKGAFLEGRSDMRRASLRQEAAQRQGAELPGKTGPAVSPAS